MPAEIFLFISPSLRRVNITGCKGLNKGPFLSTLLQESPSLEEISAEGFPSESLSAFAKHKGLKAVDVGDTRVSGISDLETVFGYACLTALRVSLPEFPLRAKFESRVIMPTLRTLTTKSHPTSIHDVLKCLDPTPLSSLNILYGDESKEMWESRWRIESGRQFYLSRKPRIRRYLQRLYIDYPVDMSGSIALIARHIPALFPSLKSVDGDDGDNADDSDCEGDSWNEWSNVNTMVKVYQATVEDHKMRHNKS
ncbi:hypothetical protein DXG01_016155 [Tephrocybe rancida]|nr:hypothetical protein DXG01_016155 [Tephrocybe rancida]